MELWSCSGNLIALGRPEHTNDCPELIYSRYSLYFPARNSHGDRSDSCPLIACRREIYRFTEKMGRRTEERPVNKLIKIEWPLNFTYCLAVGYIKSDHLIPNTRAARWSNSNICKPNGGISSTYSFIAQIIDNQLGVWRSCMQENMAAGNINRVFH